MPIIILRCNCIHEYQDKKHGKGNRIHNTITKSDNSARCTVCGNIRQIK